jgi:hypothetical protein
MGEALEVIKHYSSDEWINKSSYRAKRVSAMGAKRLPYANTAD